MDFHADPQGFTPSCALTLRLGARPAPKWPVRALVPTCTWDRTMALGLAFAP